MTRPPERVSVLVIGAGFGGLGAALTLAEQGVDVMLCESLDYAGGCASTFSRFGLRWESGATMFSGFGEGQLFRRWIERYELPVRWRQLDPVMRLRLGEHLLTVPASRDAWAARLAALPGAPVDGIHAFFAEQGEIADALWGLLDRPELLPPLDTGALVNHVWNVPRYARIAPWVGRSLLDVAAHHGVADFAPLRQWLDAACQITVQVPADRAEAPFAVGAIDFLFRGTTAIDGGVGRLADGLLRAVELAGGRVRMLSSVRGVRQVGDQWLVDTRSGLVRCDAVVANVLPPTASRWLGEPVAAGLSDRLDAGWGACVLYAALEEHPSLPVGVSHHQVVRDPRAPLIEGNHALITVGEPQVFAGRTVRATTISTHMRMNRPPSAVPTAVATIQDRLRARLTETFPDVAVALEMPGSSRAFERFTGRHRGLVGGLPREVGLANYLDMVRPPHQPGFWLVGDSVFPGQSALAAAIGGERVAHRVLRAGQVHTRSAAAK